MNHPHQLLSFTKSQYFKFRSRLEKSISTGKFEGLPRRRKHKLVARVEKFRARLESMSLSMKGAAVAGSVAAGTVLPNIGAAQTQGHGTFQATTASVIGSYAQFPVMADIDGDGNDELIFKSSSSDIRVQNDLTVGSGTILASGGVFTVTDFDDDGDFDLLIGDGSDIKIYTNDGGGNFSYAFGTTAPGEVHDLAAADIDDDGDKDVISATDAGAYVDLNDDNLGFGSRNLISDNSSQHVGVGDFEADGFPDVLVSFSDETYLYSNDAGILSFTGSYGYSNLREVKVADFDGDGDLDILIAAGDNLNLLGGQGNGSFTVHSTSVPYILESSDLAIGDIDADGMLDVVLVSDQGSEGERAVTFINDGAYGFDFKQNFPVSDVDAYDSFNGLALGDVDGDDDLDLVVSGGDVRQVFENTNIAPYLTGFSGRSIIDENTSVGTFLGQVSFEDPNGDAVASISFADGANNNDLFLLDASGNITLNAELDWETLGSDLVVEIEVEDDQGNSRVEKGDLKLNNLAEEGHGIFDDKPIKLFGSQDAGSFEPGDYDQDGDADLFRSSGSYYGNDILQQNGGSFSAEFVRIKYALNEVAFIDHDNDGDLDVINFAIGRLRIAENDEGNFSQNTFIGNYNDIDQMVVGDFDDDGLMEVALRFRETGSFTYLGVRILEVGEDGEFGQIQDMLMYDGSNPPESLVDGDLENISIADFDGDGFDDLFVVTSNGDDVIFPGSASGFSTSYTTAITADDHGFAYGISGDFNADGSDDIVIARGTVSDLEKALDIYLNDGSGSFTLNQSISGTQLTALQLGDIDGDGSLDMITGSYEDDGDGQSNYDIDIRTNDGSGTFTQVQTIPDVDADDLKLMDVDGDDDLDIVMRKAQREEEDDHVLFVFKNDNVAPTSINLSATSLNEHIPLDTEIATITIDDLNLNDTHVISLVTGDGSNDLHNSFFSLNGNSLRVTKDVRFEDTPQLFIYLSVYDGHQTFEQAIVLTVNDVYQAPTGISLSSATFDEGTTPGSQIATISAIDANVGETHTFQLAIGDGVNNADNGSFVVDGNRLLIVTQPSFETQPSYSIYLSASDPDGSIEEAFVLTVNDVNQAATDIALSNLTLEEGTDGGTVIASITVTDPNTGDSHDLSLASGDGTNDANNDLFLIGGNELILVGNVNFNNTPTLNILISATDAEGSFEKAFTLTVNDALGLADEVSNTLGVYPNPGADQLSINFEHSLQGDLTIKILDLAGRTIHSIESVKNQSNWSRLIDMAGEKAGVYLVEMTLEGEIFRQRWVKQ